MARVPAPRRVPKTTPSATVVVQPAGPTSGSPGGLSLFLSRSRSLSLAPPPSSLMYSGSTATVFTHTFTRHPVTRQDPADAEATELDRPHYYRATARPPAPAPAPARHSCLLARYSPATASTSTPQASSASSTSSRSLASRRRGSIIFRGHIMTHCEKYFRKPKTVVLLAYKTML